MSSDNPQEIDHPFGSRDMVTGAVFVSLLMKTTKEELDAYIQRIRDKIGPKGIIVWRERPLEMSKNHWRARIATRPAINFGEIPFPATAGDDDGSKH